MRPRWEDVAARARGLQPRLRPMLRADGPAEGAEARDEAALLESAAILERWLGPRRRYLRAWREDHAVSRVRALLRGLAQGVPATERLDGLPPPAGRRERTALAAAATAPTAADACQLLVEQGHPLAPWLDGVSVGVGPEGLLEVEWALCRAWADRVRDGARGGGRRLRRWAAEEFDVANALALLDAEAWREVLPSGRVLLASAPRLGAGEAESLVTLPHADRVAAVVERLGRHWVAAALTAPLGVVEGRVRHARWQAWERRRRRRPVGPAPVIAWLAAHALAHANLRTRVAGCGLGAPRAPVLAAAGEGAA